MDRIERILDGLAISTGTGLEIGALHHPVLTRDRAGVFYVDHADTAALKEKYMDHDGVTGLVDVDFVWSDNRLTEATAGAGPFDFVIASHVIEHVPNLVRWLGEVSEVLKDGGILSLAIPDKRFCFDARRALSGAADVLDAYLSDRRRPTAGTVFDFYSRITEVDTPAVWAKPQSFPEPADDEIHRGWEWAKKASATGDYLDVHCWTFTPETFLEIIRTVTVIGLVDFELFSFQPTGRGELEFYVKLRKLPTGSDVDASRRRQLHALRQVGSVRSATQMVLSPSEVRIVETKRLSLKVVRRTGQRVRVRLGRR